MITMHRYFFWIVIGMLFNSSLVLADLGPAAPYKSPANSAVVKVIEQAGEIQRIQKELLAVLQQLDRDKEECLQVADEMARAGCIDELRELLEKAKTLFRNLNQQAQNVEAEIALTKEKLGSRHLDRLDRILEEVRSMRKITMAEMNIRRL